MVKKTSIFVVWVLIAVNVFAQQDSAKQVFHIKQQCWRTNGVSFSMICRARKEYQEIFICKSGIGYFYWTNKNGSSTIPLHSVLLSSDTGNINEIRRIITPVFFDSLHSCCTQCPETGCGYIATIMEQGKVEEFLSVDIDSVNKVTCQKRELAGLIKILNKLFKEYGRTQ